MFKRWLRKLFSIFKRKNKVDNTHIISKPVPVASEKIVTKKERTTKGYRSSPYSQQYTKPETKNHQFKQIETSVLSDTKPQTIEKPKLVDKAPVKRMITGSVNFYETADLTDTPVTAIATEPVVEKVQNTPVQVLAEEPAAEELIKTESLVMNGYGVKVEVIVTGEEIDAYLDTGEDKIIFPGQKVILSHWNGSYDKKVALVVGATGKERLGKTEEVLIQDVGN